jgi:uncharacterized protein YqeY
MAQPQERVQNDLKEAMKAGDKERTGTLRMLLAELKNERIRGGGEVAEETFFGILQKGVKQRQDSAEQYRAAGRAELAEKEDREAKIFGAYLPEPVSEDEVRAAIRDFAAAESLGPKDLGKVMGAVLPRFKGRIDGKVVQRLAREVLGA